MRVVSGIQPTGNLHLGNYLGAIRNWVSMQDEGECLYFLADLHAISMPYEPALQWLLNGTARMGWLNRMTQWKDKAGKNREGQSVALFSYPVLQAADVLLYQATHVPVGEDQKQHLELTRDIAAVRHFDFGAPS